MVILATKLTARLRVENEKNYHPEWPTVLVRPFKCGSIHHNSASKWQAIDCIPAPRSQWKRQAKQVVCFLLRMHELPKAGELEREWWREFIARSFCNY